MASEHRAPLSPPTISVTDEDHVEKVITESSHGSDSRRHSLAETHRMNNEAFERASDVESNHRPIIYPVISYASQIGGEGGIEDPEHEKIQTGEKDPNLVEWDGPNDPKNPYNW